MGVRGVGSEFNDVTIPVRLGVAKATTLSTQLGPVTTCMAAYVIVYFCKLPKTCREQSDVLWRASTIKQQKETSVMFGYRYLLKYLVKYP